MKVWRHLNPRDLCRSYPLTWYLPTRCLSTAERSKDSPPKSTHITPGCLIIKCLIHMWNCKHSYSLEAWSPCLCPIQRNCVISFSQNCLRTVGKGKKRSLHQRAKPCSSCWCKSMLWQEVTPFHVNGMHQGSAQSGSLQKTIPNRIYKNDGIGMCDAKGGFKWCWNIWPGLRNQLLILFCVCWWFYYMQ